MDLVSLTEKFTHLLRYLRFMLTPALAGGGLGLLMATQTNRETGLVLVIVFALLGAGAGVVWARWYSRNEDEYHERRNRKVDES